MGIGPLLYCISVVMIKYVHIIIFPEPEEKKRNNIKWNRGHHNVPDILGVKWEKFPIERGEHSCGKARERSVIFPERGNTHRYPLNLLEWGGGGLILAVFFNIICFCNASRLLRGCYNSREFMKAISREGVI